MTFNDAKHVARMTTIQIAEYLNISISTIKRYEKTGRAPKAVIECLRLIGGQLPKFAMRNDFIGWSFGNGYLWSPAGDKYTAGDVLAIIYDKQLIKSLEIELTRQTKSRLLGRVQFEDTDIVIHDVPSNIIPFPAQMKQNRQLA